MQIMERAESLVHRIYGPVLFWLCFVIIVGFACLIGSVIFNLLQSFIGG